MQEGELACASKHNEPGGGEPSSHTDLSGKPVWRPRVILSATASAIWSIKMKHIWHEILPLKEMKERTIYNSLPLRVNCFPGEIWHLP